METTEYRIINDKYIVAIVWECFPDDKTKYGDPILYYPSILDVRIICNKCNKIKARKSKAWEVLCIADELKSIEKEVRTGICNKIPF